MRPIFGALLALLPLYVIAQPGSPPATDAEYLYLKVTSAIAEGEIAYAQQLLEQMMQSQPTHAGAWLDAAMLWCQLGQTKKAFALWDEIELRFNPPIGITEFIAAQRRQSCAVTKQKVSKSIQIGRGYSTNINQGPSNLDLDIPTIAGPTKVQLLPEAAPRSDAFSQAEFSMDGIALTGNWKASLQAQIRYHDSSHDMDMQTLMAETYQMWQWRSLKGLTRYSLSGAFLDGSLYQRSLQYHFQLGLPLPSDHLWRGHISLTGSKVQYPSLRNFNADRWEITSLLEHESPSGLWQGSLTALYDAGARLRPGGDKQGWASSLRWSNALRYSNSHLLVLRTGLDWQHWDSKGIYAPGFIHDYRSQRTHSKYISVTRVYDQKKSLTLEAKTIRNMENISVFSYRAKQFQLSWRHIF